MEDIIIYIVSSISAFFGVILAYFLGIFTLLGSGIALITTFLMGAWAAIVAFLTWALPASFISSISTLFAWVYPIVAKIAPFITVSKNGKKAASWCNMQYKKLAISKKKSKKEEENPSK